MLLYKSCRLEFIHNSLQPDDDEHLEQLQDRTANPGAPEGSSQQHNQAETWNEHLWWETMPVQVSPEHNILKASLLC